ncbi:hypothetical protein Ahy_A09g043734 [Arachis hypogaea]|uniref:Ribosomal Proteins L2 RNA binding domain-containing protein n=1 Tax=Arachis hypogaea TaxID=3818 RepID=A0A445BIY4_ARAHY|nr:hypothetical protein Ahy_A09g043734 [Arachis hypogaea]
MSSVKRALCQFTFGTDKTGTPPPLQRSNDLKHNAAPSSLGVVERIEYDPNRSSDGSKESSTVLYWKKSLLSCCANHSISITLPKATIRSAVCSGCIENTFFAPRARGEVELHVQNWKKNNDTWMHKNKRKAKISWHNITRYGSKRKRNRVRARN